MGWRGDTCLPAGGFPRALASPGMMTRVKEITRRFFGRRTCSPVTVGLLDAKGVGPTAPLGPIELLTSDATDPPKWVRLLAAGVNQARDGRRFTVTDPAAVVARSNEYKGAIDLVVDFEHQFDRARENGKPAPASGWIKELSAAGPRGEPGVWARIEWLPSTLKLIQERAYRYLSAAVAYDGAGNVMFVPRAALTNHPALDAATALFSSTKEHHVNLLQKLLAAFGLSATTTEDDAVKHATALGTLCASLAKLCGVEIAALSAMTAEQVSAALQKPLAEKLATLSATANVAADASADAIVSGLRALGADPKKYIDRSVYDEVAGRLATLTAETKGKLIDDATKAGKLTPGMKAWAKGQSFEQLTDFLSAAPVIVAPNGGGGGGGGPLNIATLSAEEKAAAQKHGVTEEAWLAAKQEEAAVAARHRQLAAS